VRTNATLSAALLLLLLVRVNGSTSILDTLAAHRVFACHPTRVTVEGHVGQEGRSSDTLWADSILSGLESNRYEYFLIRRPTDPVAYKFELVFFDKEGRGEFVGIPSGLITALSDSKLTFSFELTGGGEAGSVRTTRTISISRQGPPEVITGVIDEKSVFSRLLSSARTDGGSALFEFEAVKVSDAVFDAAMNAPSAKQKRANHSTEPTPGAVH
jgi:hypothetical protein